MGRRPRNDGLTMTTFYLQKRDRGRRIHKTANANAFNFTRQIARSNCTAIFTKCDKSRATMFNTWCKSTVVCYRFYRVEALPLDSTRFLRLATRSQMAARSSARRQRDVRATSRQWPDSGNGNAAECPSRRLARQLVVRRTWLRNVRAGNLRDNSQLGRATTNATSHQRLVEIPSSAFYHDIQKL